MEPSCDECGTCVRRLVSARPASSMAMDAADEHTAVDDKDELIACLNEQVAQQRELIVKQAQELSAAKLQAHKNKVDYHCMHSKVDNLLADRAKLVNDIAIGRDRERQLVEKLLLCTACK